MSGSAVCCVGRDARNLCGKFQGEAGLQWDLLGEKMAVFILTYSSLLPMVHYTRKPP